MIVRDPNFSRADELKTALEQQLGDRTAGQLRYLHVEITDESIVVRGCTTSGYIKQIVVRTLLDILDSTRTPRLDLQIQVDADNGLPVTLDLPAEDGGR